MTRRIITFIMAIILCFGFKLEAKNVALLVGIGNYDKATTGWSVIHGNNDVELLSGKLKNLGFSVSTLVDKIATKANILKSLKHIESIVSKGDLVYLHFSGHGQLIEDLNNDEQGEMDQSFVCYDACFSSKYRVGGLTYRGQNHLIDDELFPFINRIKRKVGGNGNVVVVFDSCFSEGTDRGEITEEADPECDVDWTNTSRGTDYEFQVNQAAETYLRSIRRPGSYSKGGGSLTIISACGWNQVNYECKAKHSGRKYGSLSYCISKLLDMKVPLTDIADYFKDGRFRKLKIVRASQTPVVDSHN